MNDHSPLKDLPKAELHAHLNGCVPPTVVHALVEKHKVEIPPGYTLPGDLMIQSPVSSLAEYFRPWHVFKRLPIGRACLDEMFAAAASHLASDGVRYAELRNSPFNISDLNGISLETALEWLVESASKASTLHDIDIRLVISLTRYNFDLARSAKLLSAIQAVSHDKRIVALDLSGDEDVPVSPDVSTLFRQAKAELGLGVTVHAGETGNPASVRWAVEECLADRVGHGLAAVNDPHVVELLRTRQVCVEVCLHSNLMTRRSESLDSHPIHAFIDESVPFVLCTDNPQVHGVSLSEEYALFLRATGREDMIANMYDVQMMNAFGS